MIRKVPKNLESELAFFFLDFFKNVKIKIYTKI